MRPEHGHGADWRDAAAYAPLLAADRSVFAWEWLRRDPDYRAAAERAREWTPGSPPRTHLDAARWGLHAFEAPHLGAPAARPLWRADVHPYVLEADAAPAGEGCEGFELDRLAIPASVTASEGREHLLISDGLRTVRIDLLTGTVRQGPVRLGYRLSGLSAAERPLLALRRLLALWRTERFSARLHPPEARARRFVLMLRAHDALASGATQREIAAELLSPRAGEGRWRSDAPSLRSQAQRLVRGARTMARRYLSLLQ